MKTDTPRLAIRAGLFAVALLGTWACATVAVAQLSSVHPAFEVRFTLPYEVHWGRKIVPAGQYKMQLDSSHLVGLVESADEKTMFFTTVPIRKRSDRGPAALMVVVHGNERIVRSLNLPASDICLTYQPTSRAEREILAEADQLRTVPVLAAGK